MATSVEIKTIDYLRDANAEARQSAFSALIKSNFASAMMVMMHKYWDKIDQWDNPENEEILIGKLKTFLGQEELTKTDLIKIALLCAILFNME